MYKDDNMITNDVCCEKLLRQMIDGSSNAGCDSTPSECRVSWGLKGYPLASVYAPLQEFDNIYSLEAALKQGTVFAELDLPFSGRTIQRGGRCNNG